MNWCGYVLGHSDRYALGDTLLGLCMGDTFKPLLLVSACDLPALLCNDPDLQSLLPGLTSELSPSMNQTGDLDSWLLLVIYIRPALVSFGCCGIEPC